METLSKIFMISNEIEIDYPYEFTCPIGYNLIKDPVIDEFGYTYDKNNIDEWLKQKKICPLNNKPYNNSNLVPNRALKESIEKFIEENNLQGKKIKIKDISSTNKKEFIFNKDEFTRNLEFKNRIVKFDENHYLHLKLNYYLHLKLKIPKIKSDRKHSIILLDTSGSMGLLAKLKNSSGIVEDQGLSLLKVSIHAIKTLLSSFEDGDYISIITFDDTSEIIENLIEFNKNEKVRIFNKLDSIQVRGTTNLENGLEECYKICSAYPDLFNTVILFTDGRPDSCRSTWDRILDNYERTYNIFPKIDAIGFSNNIDVDSLKLISSHSKGTYCFIPDSGMISDIMINYSARYKNMIINKNCVEFNIKLPKNFEFDNKLIYGVDEINLFDDNIINLKTGSLISDQEKNILIPIIPISEDSFKEFENKVTININDTIITKKDKLILEDSDISNEVIRYNFLNLLNFIQKQAKRTQYDICRKEILKFLDEYDKYSDNLIIKDLEGQVLESVSNSEYWNNWGYKYIVSLYFAHNNEYCNNYKDFGVQKYITSEFENLREIYSEMFNKIPPPKPDIKKSNSSFNTNSYRSSVDMSSFNNRGGVCFTGDNYVYLKFENEIYKDKIENIKKDDLVGIDFDKDGKLIFDKIECIIKTDFTKYDNGKTNICKISIDQENNKFLNISPLHPIIKDNKWIHPKDLVKPILTECNYVYSFLLKNRNNIIVNDIKCSTLAHGIIGNVIEHDYFGSEKIVNDLKKLKGWDNGIITITPNDIKRNKNTNFIEGIYQ